MGLVLFAIVAGVFWLLRRSAKKSARPVTIEPTPEPEKSDKAKGPPPGLKKSFRDGLRLLKQHVAGKDFRYQIPWFCMLGQTGSRRRDLLANAGLNLPYGLPDEEGLSSNTSCNWWFLDRGLILDLGGEYVLRSDGRTADDSGWKSFIGLLQRHRPHRPLDGVILTIPCSDLLRMRDSADVRTEIEQKANFLHNRLWELQDKVELRFPVYVVVTGCHEIRGFRSFTAAMPARHRGDMFGWSSPYNIDAAYQPVWVDEAFHSLRKHIADARLKIYAASPEVRAAEQILLFPGNFVDLKEPLRIYLSNLFKQTVYHESMFFRGVYFSGSADLPELELKHTLQEENSFTDASLPNGGDASTLFLKDLFERKILAESALARPTARRLVRRNRRVRLAKWATAAAAVLLVAGVWRNYRELGRRTGSLELFLQQVAGDIRDVSADTEPDWSELRQRAERQLEMMSTTDFSWFGSLFLPSSWFSSFNDDVTESILQSFDKIILPAMYYGLNEKASQLITSSAPVRAASDARAFEVEGNVQVAPIEQMPAFVALRRYVDALMELEANGERYNELERTQNLESLNTAVSYVFERPLPSGFTERGNLYRQALEDATYTNFAPADFRDAAMDTANALAQDFYGALFRENELIQSLREWNTVLPRLESQLAGNGQAADTLETFLDVISQTERARAQPELRWAFRDNYDLGPAFNQLTVDIADSAFLGDDVRQQLRERTRTEWEQAHRFLVDFGTRYTREEQLALDTFLQEEFMQRNAARHFVTHMLSGQWINWDTERLNRALGYRESYENFLAGRLEAFPTELRTAVSIVARTRIGANVSDLIAEAQQIVPHQHTALVRLQAPNLRAAIHDFAAAAPYLTQLEILFDDLRQRESANDLSFLIEQQAEHLLRDIDGLLDEEELYVPRERTLAWWDGTNAVAHEAFDVPDEAALSSYLAAQRSRLRELATELAQPVITAVGAGGSEVALLAKWERILTELADYDNQKPGNQLAALETFIATEMQQIRLASCFDRARAPAVRASAFDTYFGQKRRDLERQLFEQCVQLAYGGALAGYREIERFFSDRLAGRFPFSDPSNRRDAQDSAPEDIRAFFRIFDRYERFIAEMPEDSDAFQGAGRAVHEFMAQMRDVRSFFESYLEAEDPAAPLTFEIEPEFRVNREREVGAEAIMTWELRVGRERVSHRSEAQTARWSIGERTRLMLRWAKDAPRAPLADPLGPVGSWEARTVVFEYNRPWSLVELLQTHRASDVELADRREDQPHVLKFVVPTRPVGARGEPGPPSLSEDAIAYVRVRVKPFGAPPAPLGEGEAAPSAEYLELPARFPVSAPRMTGRPTE